eukprot:1486543-Rhodomonas_salina.1
MTDTSDSLPAFVCSITNDLMKDPVIAADGHSYERAAIEKWLHKHDTSPLTGAQLSNNTLTPNIALRNAIEEWEGTYAERVPCDLMELFAEFLAMSTLDRSRVSELMKAVKAMPHATKEQPSPVAQLPREIVEAAKTSRAPAAATNLAAASWAAVAGRTQHTQRVLTPQQQRMRERSKLDEVVLEEHSRGKLLKNSSQRRDISHDQDGLGEWVVQRRRR